MNQAPFAFDLSMYEIFGNLAYGGKIVLSSREDLTNLSSWLDYIAKEQISTWVSTPSFAMQQVLNPKFNQENLPSIKEFLFCGEKLGKPVVNMLSKNSQMLESLILMGQLKQLLQQLILILHLKCF